MSFGKDEIQEFLTVGKNEKNRFTNFLKLNINLLKRDNWLKMHFTEKGWDMYGRVS